MKLFKNLQISSTKFIFFLSLYLGFVLNAAFFKTLFSNFELSSVFHFLCLFFLCVIVPLPLFAFLNIILVKRTIKFLSCLILLISSGTNYIMFKMGVHLDRSMMANVFETNLRESMELISTPLVLNVLIFGVIPALLICKTKIRFSSLKVELIRRSCAIGVSVLVVLAYLLVFGKFVIPFARNHREIRSQYNTLNYIMNTTRYAVKVIKTPKHFTVLDENPKSASSSKNVHVFVLVVGETARTKNFSLYGYEKETNPLLKKEKNLIVVDKATSCGTATAISVPCMFSAKNRSHFDKSKAPYEENLLDIVKKAGWDVVWLENDDGCKGVCDRVEYHNIVESNDSKDCFGDFCRDEALMPYLDNTLKKITKNTVIVLHTMGSHGPAYYKRYPKEFEKFKPTCDTANTQNCTNEELVNTYDNTILYTDYIISKVIDSLKSYKNYETSLLYLSDHGESLGEGGLYLHGMPYKIAPDEQKNVPFFMWFSDKALKGLHMKLECLKNTAFENPSHDNLFHTVLGITETKTKLYDPKLDLISYCRQ